LPEAQKLSAAFILFVIGISGFCVSVFGMIASTFLFLSMLSVVGFFYIVFSYIKTVGLLSFLPESTQDTLLSISFFDILVNIIIKRRISKMLIALFSPFFRAKTPEEVKELLKQEGKIPKSVYKALFRKGIVNNFPTGLKSLMYPARQ